MSIRSLLGLQKYTGVERGDGEDFEAYKKRRKAQNLATKRYLRGRFIWISKDLMGPGGHLIPGGEGRGTYSRQKHGEIGRKLVIQ